MQLEGLINHLTQCNKILKQIDEGFWSEKIDNAIHKARKGYDYYLILEILSWFGGMGSFTDLYISRFNGYKVREEDEGNLNTQFRAIREKIYLEALELKKIGDDDLRKQSQEAKELKKQNQK